MSSIGNRCGCNPISAQCNIRIVRIMLGLKLSKQFPSYRISPKKRQSHTLFPILTPFHMRPIEPSWVWNLMLLTYLFSELCTFSSIQQNCSMGRILTVLCSVKIIRLRLSIIPTFVLHPFVPVPSFIRISTPVVILVIYIWYIHISICITLYLYRLVLGVIHSR